MSSLSGLSVLLYLRCSCLQSSLNPVLHAERVDGLCVYGGVIHAALRLVVMFLLIESFLLV